MGSRRSLRLALPLVLVIAFGFVSCHNNDTTTAPGAIASITVSAPGTVTSDQSFSVDVNATAIGVNNVHNGHVNVTVPSPLQITAVSASGGTTASFTAGSSSWDLGTLDSNSNAHLNVTVVGTLPAGSSGQQATITATLTGDGINAGDAVATANVQVNP